MFAVDPRGADFLKLFGGFPSGPIFESLLRASNPLGYYCRFQTPQFDRTQIPQEILRGRT